MLSSSRSFEAGRTGTAESDPFAPSVPVPSLINGRRPYPRDALEDQGRERRGAGARPMRLAALVVTYNRFAQVTETVNRLLAESCDRIYVVDNGSKDGTREWLAQVPDKRLRVVHAPHNLGGAGGFECGLRTAIAEYDPDWIVLMDDDGRPRPGCFDAFRDADHTGWDAVSAAVYLQSGAICEMNRPTINPFWHLPTFARTLMGSFVGRTRACFHVSDEAYRSGPIEIDTSSFVGLFLSRDTIKRAGYPDGQLFIYGDDVLYTLGMRKAGMRIGFMPWLEFEHDFNRAMNGSRARYNPIWKAYYTARNGLFAYRFAAGLAFWPILSLILLKWALEGRHYGEHSRVYYRLLWHGIKDGLAGRRSRPHSEVMSLAVP